jgi:hypothetical protein
MSTEPYPEVSGDESGIVPPQSGRSPEWPKKIRTLTASELDRLTIDSTGRFYWDGKLVNYEPPQPSQPGHGSQDPPERSAAGMIDHTTFDLGEHRSPESVEAAGLPAPVGTLSPHERDELRSADFDVPRSVDNEHLAPAVVPMTHSIRAVDRVRLSMSGWQSIGAIIVVMCVMAGASGMAAYGWVVAHDWGCRIGVVKRYCPPPPPPPPQRPPRPEIPA